MNIKTATQIIEKNIKAYNKIAKNFSNTRNRQWPEFDVFFDYLNDNDHILDIGCGNGRLVNSLNNKSLNYTGIDISEDLLQQAKNLHPDKHFKKGDILNIDYKEKYNAIFCIAILNHIPSKPLQQKAVKNLYNALKPGGYLFMTNWNLWQFSFKRKSIFKYTLQRILHPDDQYKGLSYKDILTTWKSGNNNQAQLYYYAFKLSELKKLLKSAGFTIEQAFYSNKHWYKKGNLIIIAKK